MDIRNIAEATVGLGLVAWNTFSFFRGRRDKRVADENGLLGNPTRCVEHAKAINELRDDVKLIKAKLDIV